MVLVKLHDQYYRRDGSWTADPKQADRFKRIEAEELRARLPDELAQIVHESWVFSEGTGDVRWKNMTSQ